MASKYKRHSTGGRFKKRSASDLGKGAIKTQADIVIDSLKLQKEAAKEDSKNVISALKGIGNAEIWNLNVLSDLRNSRWKNEKEAIKVSHKTELDSLDRQIKYAEGEAKYWEKWSPTLAKTATGLLESSINLKDKLWADARWEEVEESEILDDIDGPILELLLNQTDESFKNNDNKSLKVLRDLFSKNNRYFRAKLFKKIKTDFPNIAQNLKDTIIKEGEKNESDLGRKPLKWTPSFIQGHYETFAKTLIREYNLGKSKEAKELLEMFSVLGAKEAEYEKNLGEVNDDSEKIVNSLEEFVAVKDVDPESFIYKAALQNLYSSVFSAKRKTGENTFASGYSPNEKIAAWNDVAQRLAVHIPDPQEFEDIMMSVPTPGNHKQDWNKRNKEPLKNEQFRLGLRDIHNNVWRPVAKNKKEDFNRRQGVAVSKFLLGLNEVDTTTEDGQNYLSKARLEYSQFPLVQAEIGKAQAFNFNNKGAYLINDDILKAAREGDLGRLVSIVPYLSKDAKTKFGPLLEELNLFYQEVSKEELNNWSKIINTIEEKERLVSTNNTTESAKEAYRQVLFKALASMRGTDLSMTQKVQKAKEIADNQAWNNSGLFRRDKTPAGELTWMAWEDDSYKWTSSGDPSKNTEASGLTKDELNTKLKSKRSVENLLNDSELGKNYNIIPLDDQDLILKTLAAGNSIAIPAEVEQLYKAQPISIYGTRRLSRTEILNRIIGKGTGQKRGVKSVPQQADESDYIVPPGNLDKALYEVERSEMNFPNFYSASPSDQVAWSALASSYKEIVSQQHDQYPDIPQFKVPISNSLAESFKAANGLGIDIEEYLFRPPVSREAIFGTYPKKFEDIIPTGGE